MRYKRNDELPESVFISRRNGCGDYSQVVDLTQLCYSLLLFCYHKPWCTFPNFDKFKKILLLLFSFESTENYFFMKII